MTPLKSISAASLLLLSINANAAIVDINATVASNGTTLSLTAGTYNVSAIGVADGGLYNAWNAWGTVAGCDANGGNCSSGGYITAYDFEIGSSGSTRIGTTAISDRYETDLLALANAVDFSFTLTSNSDVSFSIIDNYGDNLGGVSLNVTAVSAVPVPAAVWLFGSGLLGLAGIAKRKKVQAPRK